MALVQLNAYGSNDTYLTAEPVISFWKGRTKPYTAFATESIQCVWNNNVGFGQRSTAILPKTGDLVSQMWLEIDLPDLTRFVPTPNTATNIKWANTIALIIISSIQLDVGSTRLDRYPGYFADLWSELTEAAEKRHAFNRMVGKFDNFDNTSASNSSAKAQTFFVPLLFFPNMGSAMNIPVAALQFNEVRVNMELRNYLDCVVSSVAPVQSLIDSSGNPLQVGDVRLYVDYVYLSAPEKNRFVSLEHDILYAGLQETGQNAVLAGSSTFKLPLSFSNLITELIFIYQPKASVTSNTLTGNRWTDCIDAFAKVELQVNGTSLFTPRSAMYFNYAVPYKVHHSCPRLGVHCYSFALHPGSNQPSGTINSSRLDSMSLNFNMKPNVPDGFIVTFARSLNVFTVKDGQSGLRFNS